jgi:uncharacterized protein (DUF427 family)
MSGNGFEEFCLMAITIREKSTDATLAQAEEGTGVIAYEGNWYFAPEAVDQNVLRLTPRTYTCPYKGTCHWVDFVASDGRTVRDVAWVYATPKPGHEVIQGRYGFYAGTRGGTIEER